MIIISECANMDKLKPQQMPTGVLGTLPDCTGLKQKWKSTMQTITHFPITSGTSVEVTCSHSDAVIEGSKHVTCITGTVFTFSEEPSCLIQGFILLIHETEFAILAMHIIDITMH